MADREFLVSYEYGHGKAWAFVVADSPEQIVAAAPALDIVAEPPATLTEMDLAALRSHRVRLDRPVVQAVLETHLV
jgi:hypothetical protein